MCTVLLLLRPGERWPLLLGSNRDERLDRPFDPPGRWWDDAPAIVGWRDRTSGGTWLAANDAGVVATLVNGMDQLGPLPGKATRGGLVLRALRESHARDAAESVAALSAHAYGRFTLLVADRGEAFTVTNDGERMRIERLAPGHHMVTPEGCDVPTAPRYRAYFPELLAAEPPDPGIDMWASWIALLQREDRDDPHHAMTVTTNLGFGTVASTLIGVPAGAELPSIRFAPGPPTRAAFQALSIPGFAPTTSKDRCHR